MQITVVPDDPRRHIVATYGEYVVWYDPLPHRPYGLFRIYRGERYIGAQVSWVTETDCQWLELKLYVVTSSAPRQRKYTFGRGEHISLVRCPTCGHDYNPAQGTVCDACREAA